MKNLTVSGTVKGQKYVGGVAGQNYGTITNCCSTVSIEGTSYYVGSVAGSNEGNITKCSNTGSLSSSEGYTGGVAGYNSGTITDCYNTGNVTGATYSVGGVTGNNDTGGKINNSYNTGNVSAFGSVGGVAGQNTTTTDSGSTIENSYNTGRISGTSSYVGGVAGQNNKSTINNCYNSGEVNGSNSYFGGVTGYNTNGTITNCYYLDTTTTGGINGSDADDQATKLTEAQLKAKGSFTDWDFTTIWFMGSEAPLLRIDVTVNFNANGHGTAPASQKAKGGEKLTAPNAPTADHYTFSEWYKESACTNKWDFDSDTVTQAMTLYAKWTPITYTITYNGTDGASLTKTNPAAYTIESPDIKLNNPTKTGYDFAGCSGTGITETSKDVTIAQGTTGNRTYIANWKAIVYTISCTLNGGTADNSTSYTIESPDFTLNNPTKEHQKFMGWTGTGLDAATKNVTISKGSAGNREYSATLGEYSNKYYVDTPQGLSITHSGVNFPVGVITASADAEDFDPAKTLVIRASSPNNWHLVSGRTGESVGYTLSATEWTFTAEQLTQSGGIEQKIGAVVDDLTGKRPGAYTGGVSFDIEVQD